MQVLYNLYMETGNKDYLGCAQHFDKPAFFRSMVEGHDMLAGQHANTHLAQVWLHHCFDLATLQLLLFTLYAKKHRAQVRLLPRFSFECPDSAIVCSVDSCHADTQLAQVCANPTVYQVLSCSLQLP